MYIKRTLADPEFSNLCDFSSFPQLYSEVGNTNSRLDTTLSSSVLDYALTLSEGLHAVRFPGDSYTGTDIPNIYYRYSGATIIVRSKGKIVTVLLYGISTKVPLAVHSYESESGWRGWDQYVTKDDLTKSIDFRGNAKMLKVRSGTDGLKNIYLDIEDESGNTCSLAFISDGESAVKLMLNGKTVWTK